MTNNSFPLSSDINGPGAAEAMGHIDFYPNGGSDHPGCDSEIDLNEGFFAETKRVIVCDHKRAHRLVKIHNRSSDSIMVQDGNLANDWVCLSVLLYFCYAEL